VRNLLGLRVGYGYDVHRLVPGRPLIIGGVELPYPFGLEGHSDADVLLHAITDALLGAAALGDIGAHFPNDDKRWHNASSLELLKRSCTLVVNAGFTIVNIDSTVVAEEPKLRPHIDEMRKRIAICLGLDGSRIGIKATTAEGTGPEGRQEAITARAVVLIVHGFGG
jgi:2-C-methyl-D-erythritol 2,4-cyclodiphosphate synthase